MILDLLLATRGTPLPARLAVVACALFEISDNNVRVALVRLSSAGLIEATGRGEYQLAAGADALAREVSTWRCAEERVRAWTGGYVAVHAGLLGRADRVALRRRTRALGMLGFAELERGLYVRPDNIEKNIGAVRTRLYTLGLEHEASVFVASSFAPALEARARSLWDGKALTAGYRQSRIELERWLKRSPQLEPDVAAREAFLLGGRAIRRIVYDPLLPAPFVDVEARRAFVDTVREFDTAGHRIWQRFFAFNEQPAASLTLERRAH